MEVCLSCVGTGYYNAHLIPAHLWKEGRGNINGWVRCGSNGYMIPPDSRVSICVCCGDPKNYWWPGTPGIHIKTCKGRIQHGTWLSKEEKEQARKQIKAGRANILDPPCYALVHVPRVAADCSGTTA